MRTEVIALWESMPKGMGESPLMTAYIPENKTSDAGIVIFPGGGYNGLAQHEGKGYAEFLAQNGICGFVVGYRTSPNTFPLPLIDARRSVKLVRHLSKRFGIDKTKIAVMGSSAGGHLAALCSTYKKDIDFDIEKDEIEDEDFLPNAQILCYPVISLVPPFGHEGSGRNLLGDEYTGKALELDPSKLADEETPQAFVWHTFMDEGVSVLNSISYVKRLKEVGGKAELHIYPDGRHGLGLATDRGEKRVSEHVSAWSESLLRWLKYINF